jgi:hypothetical protein
MRDSRAVVNCGTNSWAAPWAVGIAASKTATPLPESMVTGKAGSAKAAVGDQPVFAYITSLPQPQRGIAERVDALAAKTLPGLQRPVKWSMSYCGVGDGWCFCCGGFADHVKVMFVNGAALTPVPRSRRWRYQLVCVFYRGQRCSGVGCETGEDASADTRDAADRTTVAPPPGAGYRM